MALVEQGINPLIFPGLRTTITSDESKMINLDEQPQGDPVCLRECARPGRIRHHLKHNLWRKESTDLLCRLPGGGDPWDGSCWKERRR